MRKIVLLFSVIFLTFSLMAQIPTAVISGGVTVCEDHELPDFVISIAGNTSSYSVVYAIDGAQQATLITESRHTFTTSVMGTYTLMSVIEIDGDGLSANSEELKGTVQVDVKRVP